MSAAFVTNMCMLFIADDVMPFDNSIFLFEDHLSDNTCRKQNTVRVANSSHSIYAKVDNLWLKCFYRNSSFVIGVFCLRAGLTLQDQAPRLQFYPRAGLSRQIQAPRLQFCPKAGLSLQIKGTRLQFCPRAGISLQIQTPRLQFYPKAGLSLQTQEPKLQFY